METDKDEIEQQSKQTTWIHDLKYKTTPSHLFGTVKNQLAGKCFFKYFK